MIELRDICSEYGGTEILRNVSLTFPDRQITVLIGPNGCGKSTLMKLCCGQMRPTMGELFVDGQYLFDLSRTNIAKKIALLSQNRTVPDITVGMLVLHGRFPWLGYPRVYRTQDEAAAKNAMARVGILEHRHKTLTQLSGGERQKAYLAMLLTQDSSNILLDEPTTYLDVAHQLELLALLKELKREGKCVVAVLHDLGAALDIADQIAVIKDGCLLAAGTPEDVIHSGAVEKAFGVCITYGERIKFTLKQ